MQQTDTHYRSDSGEGSFNWRMLFPFRFPVVDDTLTIKVYDKDIIVRDQALASNTFPLGKYIEEAYDNQTTVKLYEGAVDMKEEKQLPCQCRKDPKSKKTRYDIFEWELATRTSD